MHGTSNANAIAVFNRWRCNEAHCSNHSKHCFQVSSRHYPLNSEDIRRWVTALTCGTATIEQPPGTVWESLFARKAHDISSKKNKGLGQMVQGNRTLNNSMSHAPIINYYVGMEGWSYKRRRFDKQWEGDSSSEDSSKQSDLERERLIEHTSQKIP